MNTENLDKLLNAPVGQVVYVLGKILNSPIDIQIVEQNITTSNKFVRRVEISANGMQVITAFVEFDSSILPDFILKELLKKNQGIGDILNQYKIKPSRKIISVNRNVDENKISREYEIVIDGKVWFSILEDIRL